MLTHKFKTASRQGDRIDPMQHPAVDLPATKPGAVSGCPSSPSCLCANSAFVIIAAGFGLLALRPHFECPRQKHYCEHASEYDCGPMRSLQDLR